MTYKLEPGLGRITSPTVLIFPDGHTQTFPSGEKVASATFDHRFRVTEIKAVENTVEIAIEEMAMPGVNWTGEEQTFF